MKQRIIDHYQSGNDANIGQTLLRLAQLASLRHQMTSAQGTMTLTEDGVEGLDSEAGLVPPRIRFDHGRDRLHKEVDR